MQFRCHLLRVGRQEGVEWGVGVGWEPKVGHTTLEQKSKHCVTIEVHKTATCMQFACQADTVACKSLTLSIALLVHPSGTVHSIVDCNSLSCKNDADLVICM